MLLCRTSLLSLEGDCGPPPHPILDNFIRVSNLLFLWEVLERLVGLQLQRTLEKADYLDLLRLRLRMRFSVEIAVVSLVDNLWQNQDGGGKSILVLLSSTTTFNTVNHGVLLGKLWGLEVGATVLQWLFSFLCAQFQSKLVEGKR